VPASGFPDATGTHGRAIDCLVWYGVAAGLNDGTFGTNQDLVRRQLALFVARTLEQVEGFTFPAPLTGAFRDVGSGEQAAAINTMAAFSPPVIEGYADGTFRPSNDLTRAQAASIMARADAQVVSQLRIAPLPGGPRFSDVPATYVHASAISALAGAGIIRGFEDGSFGPNATVTRGQLASMLTRLLERYAAAGVLRDPDPTDPDPDPDPDSDPDPDPVVTDVVVRGSLEQVIVYGADPNTPVTLLDPAGDPVASDGLPWSLEGRDLTAGGDTTDAKGSIVFRGTLDDNLAYSGIPAGDGYRVRFVEDGETKTSDPITVLEASGSSTPDQSFYDDQVLDTAAGFDYIETRDGTTLSAAIFLPDPDEHGPGPYPTLVEYSGYNLSEPTATEFESNATTVAIGGLLGYATVAVNIRGSGCSGGAFDYFETIQGLDGYDIIETVAAQEWSANVGTTGVSYPGISQLFLAATQPPNLAAAAPVAIISDHARDTVMPGGIYNTGFAREWAEEREQDTRFPGGQGWVDRAVAGTHARISAEASAECAENVLLRDQNMPLLDRIEVNEFETELWATRSPYDFAEDLTTNLFIAVSSQDEQTGGRASAILDALDLERDDRIVRFAGTNGTHVEALGPELLTDLIEFLELYIAERTPVLTGRPDFPGLRAVVFPALLAGILGTTIQDLPSPIPFPADRFPGMSYVDALAAYESEPPAHILYENGAGAPGYPGFPMPAFTHRYEWEELPNLDPDFDADANTFFLREDGGMTADAPQAGDDEFTSYVYDPRSGNRAPYNFGENRPSSGSIWFLQPAYRWTQPPVDEFAGFVTEPLDETLVTFGSASVDLWIDSGLDDTDLEVVITEVRPDGEEMYVTAGWLRASKRELRDDSTALRPRPTFREADQAPLEDGWNEARVETFPFGHAFREGSRIRLTIEAPGGNRPLWRFDDTVEGGPDVENRIAHSQANPSKVVLPIVDVEVDVTPDLPGCAGSEDGEGFTAVRGQPCRTAPDLGADPVDPDPVDPACDALDGTACMLPFPSDHFTAADPSTPTGLRLDLPAAGTPLNTGEPLPGAPRIDPRRVDPTEWNRNDGFSPGATVMTYVEGLDLQETFGMAEGVELADRPNLSMAADAPIVLVDLDTGERWPYYGELDAHPGAVAADEQVLIIRPLVNFTPGHRYGVAMRDLKDGAGQDITAGDVFAWYRDGAEGDAPHGADEARATEVDALLDDMEDLGVDREDLYLAWDFTVSSSQNLTGRALAIRDEAFAELGDTDLADREVDGDAPQITVTNVLNDVNADTERRVEGRVRVPNFLHLAPGDSAPSPRPDGTWGQENVLFATSARFAYESDTPGPMDLPIRNETADLSVPFACNIPRTASAEAPATPMLYGHGLMGSLGEGNGGSSARLRERNFMNCSLDWTGMSSGDALSVGRVLQDASAFPRVADRLQQGFLNFMFMGRAMIHPDGLSTLEAFQDDEGEPLIHTDTLAYDGNSQGGILGGSLVALSPDIENGVLGVPGANYSTLLNRSVDWEGAIYGDLYYLAYEDPVERQLGYAMLQMLWDRGESNGYAHATTDTPLPNTPTHRVLLHPAFADYQVANIAAEVQARTYGARLLQTSLLEERHWSDDMTFGFELFDVVDGQVQDHAGSALVYFDSGNSLHPSVNLPPEKIDAEGDPHGDPRQDARGSTQRATFLNTGIVTDTADGGPYWTDRCRGPVNPNC
jgi:predicted acyl esterase